MTWGLWGIGVSNDPWYRTGAREPHNLLDNYYFPGYTYGSGFDGEIDDDDADQADIESAWVIGEGMDRRKPHMQRGVRYGPSQPDDPGTDTEKWLQNMGHRATQIIHQSPPTEYPLYRGMTVPDSFFQQARDTGKLTLPLSSFDLDASTAVCYSIPDPHRGYSPRTGNSVMLRMAPGGKAMPLCEGSEHLTHGDFDVIGLRPITDEDREEFGGHDDDDTMVMDIRQRSVPAPVGVPGPGEHTAHRTAMPACPDDEYMTGQCAAWAIAHQREHPHLRLGIDWQRLTPDHPDWDEEDDGDEAWQPQHVFTHDDTHAYDVRGAHPLAEVKQWDDVTLNHSPEDVMATGMYEGGYEPSAEVVQRVRPYTAYRTAMPATKDHWEPGETAHYEYHCDTSLDSSDYHLYQRTHQPVRVLGVDPDSEDFADDFPTLSERAGVGMPRTYRVRFGDGYEDTAWEDELLTGPQHYSPQWEFRTAHRTAMPLPEQAHDTDPGQDWADEPRSTGRTLNGPWFHASPHELTEGTIISPRGGESPYGDKYDTTGTAGRQDWVWMETEPGGIHHWAQQGKAPNIYLVEPHDGPYPWNNTGMEGWVANGATVVSKISDNGRLPKGFVPQWVAEQRAKNAHRTAHRTAGANGDPPEGLRFEAHDGWTHAYDNDTLIGYLRPHQGKIDMIKVHPDYRRRGIGTAMLDWHRRNVDPGITHSTDQTPLGRAWGKSLGWEPPVWNRQDPDNDTLEDYEVERGPHTAHRTAMPAYYHRSPAYLQEQRPDRAMPYTYFYTADDPHDVDWETRAYGDQVYAADLPAEVMEPDPAPRRAQDSSVQWWRTDPANVGEMTHLHDPTAPFGVPGPGERTATPYYHVSPHDLPDGTELIPFGGSSAFGPEVYDDPDHPGFEDHPNHVWMWDDLNKAVRFLPEIGAEENPDHSWEYGHVYEVQPDQEPHGSPQSGFQTNRATIIRKVPQHEYPDTRWKPPSHAHRTAMPYYHSTDAELNPGDEVKPASELGFDAYAEHGWNPLSVYDPDKVYFTQYPHDSSLPESSQFGKHTYEVEPIGDVERDEEWERNMEGQPEDYEWDTHDAGYYDYTAPRARVIRKIEPRKARIMSAAVTVYTQPNCVQCTMTKKQLDKLGIEHTTVDVSQDPDAHAYVRGLGYTAAPVVVVNDGEDHWAGFRPDRLKGLVTGE